MGPDKQHESVFVAKGGMSQNIGRTRYTKQFSSHVLLHHLDTADHLLQNEKVTDEEQPSVHPPHLGVEKLCRCEEGLLAEGDSFLRQIFEDTGLRERIREGTC